MSSVRSTAVATVCTILLTSCAVIPNDYAKGVYNPNVKSGVASAELKDSLTVEHSLPQTVLTPRGTMLVVPNYTTGEIEAVIRVSK